MVKNKREVAREHVGKLLRDRHPSASTVAWSVVGDDGNDVPGGGDFMGLELADGTLVVDSATRVVPTAADVANETARADREANSVSANGIAAKLRNKLDNLRAANDPFVKGTVTQANRDAAIRLLLTTAILGVRVLVKVVLGTLPAADAADET